MQKIKVTKIRSVIGRPYKHKRIMESLGLRKMNNSIIHNKTPEILGMIKKVSHLVKVEVIEND